MKNFKIPSKPAVAAFCLLCVVLLVCCSAEQESETTAWWNQLIDGMTKAELLLIVIGGSWVGGILSK